MRRAAAALVVVASLALEVPAAAHDHHPPGTKLWIGGEGQLGQQGSYCWTRPSGPEQCVTGCADYVWSFPPPLVVGAGEERAELVLRTRHRPRRLSIRSWTELGEYGMPEGAGEKVPYDLKRDRRTGRIVWIALMRLLVEDHLYLDAFGVWKDCEGCGGSQDSSWAFHLSAN